MTDRPFLFALAQRCGILPAYTDLEGVRHVCADDTKMTLLGAMGFSAATEDAARTELDALARQEDEALLPPVRVIPVAEFPSAGVAVRIPADMRGSLSWRAELITEEGEKLISEGRAEFTGRPTLRLEWTAQVPLGYHQVDVSLQQQHQQRRTRMRLILTPSRCFTVDKMLRGRGAFGLCANLYTLRSARNWGVGDLSDLGELIQWMGREGGAFVGVNPLHALHNRDPDISPYSPVSRLFRNPIYLDVTAVPEWTEYAGAASSVVQLALAAKRDALRSTREVDYPGVWALKGEVLRALHRIFVQRHPDPSTERGKAYADFIAAQGAPLYGYATFMALVDHQTARTGDGRDYRRWPAELRDPGSAAVGEFSRRHAADVDFHRFLQFETDRQLAVAGAECRRARLPIGLYPDLAIGSSAVGADVWARPELFVSTVRLGCPPDFYAPRGQEWGLPPVHPHHLRTAGYDYWIRMLRANLAHGGALRIDHVIGLKRQFWIPAGGKPSDGAYVRQPVSDLLGILALESTRAGAMIIGEDLGTVPEGFSNLLKRWGILSCQVMYFQRAASGEFLSADTYSDRALVTSTTHDHVSLRGFTESSDLKIRRRVGVIPDDAAQDELFAVRRGDVAWLHQRLAADKALSSAPESPFSSEGTLPQRNGTDAVTLCGGVYRFLNHTPAPLVGVMLDDLAGETEPVNVPGVGPDKLRCWSRKMNQPLESIPEAPASRAAMDALSPRKTQQGVEVGHASADRA